MPRKEFQIGEVLTAANVNTFLMDQAVMSFDDDAARGSAIPTPVEGMTTFRDDEKAVEVYANGNWNTLSQAISPNYIINGAFDVWQRGTSFLAVAGYNADRWSQPFASNNSERSTDAPSGFEYSIKFNRTSGTRATINTRLESSNVRGLLNTPITISFWAKEDAANGDTLRVEVRYASAKDNFATLVGSQNSSEFTLSTTWQRFSYTITPDSNVVDGMQITLSANAINTDFLVTGVQLEAGSVATPFKRHAPSLQGELAACQRYYQRHNLSQAGGIGTKYIDAAETICFNATASFRSEMRAAPTAVSLNAGTYANCTFNSMQVNTEGFTHRVATTGATRFRAFGQDWEFIAEL